MAAAHMHALHIAFLGITVPDGQPGGFVVCRDDYERIAVLIGKLDGLGNGLVEVQELFHGAGKLIGVAGLVYAGTFHHQEEAFALLLAGIEEINGLTGGLGKEIRTAVHNVAGFYGRRQDAQFIGLGTGGIFQGIHHGESLLDGLLGFCGTLFKLFLAAGGEVNDGTGRDIGPNLVGHAPVRLVGEERGGGGTVQVVRRDHTGNNTVAFHALRNIGNGTLLHVYTHGVVIRLLAGGISGTGSGRIRSEIGGAAGGHPAQVFEIEVRKIFIIGKIAGGNLGQARAITYHQDNVLWHGGGAVTGVRGMIGTLVGNALYGAFFNFLGAQLKSNGRGQDKEKCFFHICIGFIVRLSLPYERNLPADGFSSSSGHPSASRSRREGSPGR